MNGKIAYGELELDVTHTDINRRPILSTDGTTYLWTEWTIKVMAIFNPATNSFQGLVGGVPRSLAGQFAGTTDTALRDYLAQPRRVLKLYYSDSNGATQPWLTSPGTRPNGQRNPTDANNGPITSDITVSEHHGTKTWFVYVTFTTYVRDCQDSPSPIISHRFHQSTDIDQDYFTTVVTSGTVIFDVGRLWQANQTPDAYRSQFLLPVAPGMRREHINVEVDDSNTSARYTVVDRVQTFQLGFQSPATRCEAYLTTWYRQGGLPQAVSQATTGVWGRIFSAAGQWSLDPIHDAGVAISAVGGAVGDAAAAVAAAAPRYYATIVVRAWGSKTSRRMDLFNLCMAIAIAKLGTPESFRLASSIETIVNQEVTGKYVELTITLRWVDELMISFVAGIVNMVPGVGPLEQVNGINVFLQNFVSLGSRFFIPFVAAPEAAPLLEGTPATLSSNPVGNRYPLAPTIPVVGGNLAPDAVARSADYIRQLVTNGLSGQCENPPVVGQVDPGLSSA